MVMIWITEATDYAHTTALPVVPGIFRVTHTPKTMTDELNDL